MIVCVAATIGVVRFYILDGEYLKGLRVVPLGQTIALGNAANPLGFNLESPGGITKAILEADELDDLKGKRVFRANPDGTQRQYVNAGDKMDTGKSYVQKAVGKGKMKNVECVVHINGMDMRNFGDEELTKEQKTKMSKKAGKMCHDLYKDAMDQIHGYNAVLLPFASTGSFRGLIDPNFLRASALRPVLDVISKKSTVGNFKTIVFVDKGLSKNEHFLKTVVTRLRQMTKDVTLNSTIEQVIEVQQTTVKQTKEATKKQAGEAGEAKEATEKQAGEAGEAKEATEKQAGEAGEAKEVTKKQADEVGKGKQLQDPRAEIFVEMQNLDTMVKKMKGQMPKFDAYVAAFGDAQNVIEQGQRFYDQNEKFLNENISEIKKGTFPQNGYVHVLNSLKEVIKTLKNKQAKFDLFVEGCEMMGLEFPDKQRKRKHDDDGNDGNKKNRQ